VSARRTRVVLLGSVFVAAACGLVYELVAATVSSYLLGDAVTQFSLVIGVFLSAMGVGAWLARFIRVRLLQRFIQLEVLIGLFGGLSSILFFATSAFLDPWFGVIFYGTCVVIGIMVGAEIPLLVRILDEDTGWEDALSDTLALDYIGALGGSLAFPLFALPMLGMSRAAVAFGIMNLLVAAAGATLLENKRRMFMQIGVALAILVAAMVGSTRLIGVFEDVLYQDDVIYAESSRYQRVVLTRWREDVRLYIDGAIQFSSVDEARYHEALVVPAMEAAGRPQRVLVLGGGDGLAVRDILAYPSVEHVTVVDLDPAITALGTSRKELVALNKGSLSDPRVTVHNADAMGWLEASTDSFDVILIDLPDPHSAPLAKLYSREFYALVARRMSEHGAMATQATSPFYAPEAYWCVAKTLSQAVDHRPLHARPYHMTVPSFGEWGFVLATHHPVDIDALSPSIPTRHLTPGVLRGMFEFGRSDEPPAGLAVNRLDDPILHTYYRRGWQRFNQ
jgi:spermidine synthase